MVGFQVQESVVDESVANKFTCIQILSGEPLSSEARIMFHTEDGSAKGLSILYYMFGEI